MKRLRKSERLTRDIRLSFGASGKGGLLKPLREGGGEREGEDAGLAIVFDGVVILRTSASDFENVLHLLKNSSSFLCVFKGSVFAVFVFRIATRMWLGLFGDLIIRHWATNNQSCCLLQV